MKLLFIRSTKGYSGAERYNAYLIHELRKDVSLDITFLTNSVALARQLQINATSWTPVEVGTKKQLLQMILYAFIFIPKYLANIRTYDVTCLESRTEMIFLTPMLKFIGYKVVWIQHGPLFVSQAAGIIKTLYTLTSRLVDAIIAVSEDTKQDLVNGGIAENKITVIYIGVDTKKIEPTPKKSNKFTVGFSGTLTKEKGIMDFAIATKGFHTLVIGDGLGKTWMQQHVQAKFTGFVNHTDRYLKNVDILLLPTYHHEGISMAILEAAAMGIPILTTNIGGNREIIKHGYNGFLYKPGDTRGMSRDIKMFSINRKKLILMGQNARQTIVDRFNIKKQAKEYAAFFRSL